MIFSSMLERLLTGREASKRRKEIDGDIAEEKRNLVHETHQLKGAIRQHEQISNSSARILQTMTHAMIMMEARRGKSQR